MLQRNTLIKEFANFSIFYFNIYLFIVFLAKIYNGKKYRNIGFWEWFKC